jgi:hypothetical protein
VLVNIADKEVSIHESVYPVNAGEKSTLTVPRPHKNMVQEAG